MIRAAVWYHMAEFITVAASSPAVVIHSKAAEGLGLGAAAWRKRDIKKRDLTNGAGTTRYPYAKE